MPKKSKEDSKLKLLLMPLFKPLHKLRSRELRLLLISRPLRLLNLLRLKPPQKKPSKRLSDLLPKRKPKELLLRIQESKSKSG